MKPFRIFMPVVFVSAFIATGQAQTGSTSTTNQGPAVEERVNPAVPRQQQSPRTETVPGPGLGGVMGTTVNAILTEYGIEMPGSVRSGLITFNVRNSGTLAHSFAIEGDDALRYLDLPVRPGETASMQVNLMPGGYRAYCPLTDHPDQPMSSRFVASR